MHLVDLFCGAGGASCGAHLAGMTVALAVDACPAALAVHAHNHPGCAHTCLELPAELPPLPPEPRHVHASPPCQSFSVANMAGHKGGAHGAKRARTRRERGLDLVVWAIRTARALGTTWSFEQVNAPEIRAALREEGADFVVVDCARLGLPQTRRRLIAGSAEIVAGLRAALRAGAPARGVRDVVPVCRGTHVRNCTTNTYRTLDGKRTLIRLTEDHPSFARDVTQPAYTATGCSPMRWWTPGNAASSTFTPHELALVQGFVN